MKNADTLTRDEIRAQLQEAIKAGDTDAFYQAFDLMIQSIGADVQQKAAEQMEKMQSAR